MKLGPTVIMLLALNVAGCSYLKYSCENIVSAPVDSIQECMFRMRLRRLAREAWHHIRCQEGKVYSKSYAKGFEDGYVDYVDCGGTGEPPAAPPVHLRRKGLRDTAAQQEIEDWFAGFRHGAAVARQSGLRESILVPIGVPPRHDLDSVSVEPEPQVDTEQLARPVSSAVPMGYPWARKVVRQGGTLVAPEPRQPVESPAADLKGAESVPLGPAHTTVPAQELRSGDVRFLAPHTTDGK